MSDFYGGGDELRDAAARRELRDRARARRDAERLARLEAGWDPRTHEWTAEELSAADDEITDRLAAGLGSVW